MQGQMNPSAQLPLKPPSRRRRLMRIGLIAIGVVLLLIAVVVGGANALERIDATSGAIPPPAGFPTDFPVYPNANLQLAAWDPSSSSGNARWLSTDSKKQVLA